MWLVELGEGLLSQNSGFGKGSKHSLCRGTAPLLGFASGFWICGGFVRGGDLEAKVQIHSPVFAGIDPSRVVVG